MKADWVNHPTGAYVELPRGLRISVLIDPNFNLYRVNFAGASSTITFEDLEDAKRGALSFANHIVADVLLALIEIAENGDSLRV